MVSEAEGRGLEQDRGIHLNGLSTEDVKGNVSRTQVSILQDDRDPPAWPACIHHQPVSDLRAQAFCCSSGSGDSGEDITSSFSNC